MLLIAAAFWGAIQYFMTQGGDGPAPVRSPSQTETPSASVIRITGEGFNPKEVTIAKGETVEFMNEDTRPHWPASDIHPIHSRCPGFDALRGLKQGERYRHAFSKSQTCFFHDHLNPLLTGVIRIK
jgi:plastocyanin